MKDEPVDMNFRDQQEAFRIASLITGFMRESLTPQERNELDDWVGESDANLRLFEELTDEKKQEKTMQWMNDIDTEARLEDLKKRIAVLPEPKANLFRRLGPYVIAASVLGALVGWYFLDQSKKSSSLSSFAQHDIAPGSNRAILTLASGKQLILDSAHDGPIVQEAGLNIVKVNAQLLYPSSAVSSRNTPVSLNTLTTPNGGQYQLLLSDGSRVWLNAGSSLTYPTQFSGIERKVELTGEAYFEVAKKNGMPFKVFVNKKAEVEVLGTHFNINAYSDEGFLTTTLLEGSVKMVPIQVDEQKTPESILLAPGQQARLQDDATVRVINNVNTMDVTAWRNGMFSFHSSPIEPLMRQLSRWYDVQIVYQGRPDYHFNGSIERSVPLSKLLHMVELSNNVHFEIRDKMIFVKP